ncbi:hypothetical protein [Dictyobacter kobayashii]|uniref:GAF domain-containing protein n=1 Tax=Dictyobacter kobayashii TaxID=2014872 RepID=A0A402AGX9_9CHLR|nr:hypothetical protein [Dictyobacter kobayashii]GCE18356.1 hypothetical protein KDK_21560 [Dictyobacter kobayashii]
MREPLTWRELLGEIVKNTQERQLILQELHISLLTLQRWIEGESSPGPRQMRQLIDLFPQYRQQLLPLVIREYESINNPFSISDENVEIPATFYARVLSGSSTVSDAIRFWMLSSLIIQQALAQLDPYRQGLALRIVRCMPPQADGKVYSLLECYGQGTTPWKNNLEAEAILLGVESLAGQAVIMRKVIGVHPYNPDQSNYTINGTTGLRNFSASAYPIQHSNRVAGCLIVTSAQADYFTPALHTLAQHYADLLAIAFYSTDFYEAHHIYLHFMPAPDEQRQYLSSFRQRVAAILRDALQQKQQIDTHLAELRVWQQFEAEFLTQTMPKK